ncbi:Ku protein [Streptacidiphilus sp. EB129]|uniref:non-homologous end joining protein Ku n=1 Tax=Streptacidiphilus sp. EB129 TaxID=3156262 RepID=UPI003515301B
MSVPVSLERATEEHTGPRAHQVHERDGGRIKLKRFCELEDAQVPYAEIAKGYDTPDGRTAVVTEEDLKELPLPSKKVVDVLAFVDADSIDPLRLGTPYYVTPAAKTPNKPYVLLRDAMRESGRIAVTKVTLSTRESLAVLRVVGDLIVLQTALWPDEIRSPEGLAPPSDVTVHRQELAMARSLMTSMSRGFDLEALHDDYAAAMRALVDARLKGETPPRAQVRQPAGPVQDLMAALSASVEDAQRGRGDAEPGKPARKVTAKRARHAS